MEYIGFYVGLQELGRINLNNICQNHATVFRNKEKGRFRTELHLSKLPLKITSIRQKYKNEERRKYNFIEVYINVIYVNKYTLILQMNSKVDTIFLEVHFVK